MSSSKNPAKGTKKERDAIASGRGKRRGNVSNASHTSDEGITPVSSRADVNEPLVHPLDEALTGEEIDALRIREEDFKMLHQPKPPAAAKPEQPRKVLIRKHKSLTKSEHKKVAVLKPLPPGSEVHGTVTLGAPVSGPRFDQTGTLMAHSILGKPEDYIKQCDSQQQHQLLTQPLHVAPSSAKPSLQFSSQPSETIRYDRPCRETNALNTWEVATTERRRQLAHVTATVKSPSQKLAMHQANNYRSIQEERTMIEQLIPPVDSGKGHHVGCEFWRQQVQMGDSKTGLNITLTRTEKGLESPLEFVGLPNVVKRELGITSSVEKNAPLHHTWSGSSYLARRKKELQFNRHYYKPEMSELQVVGNAHPQSPPSTATRSASLDSLDSLSSEEEPVTQVDPLASITDVVEKPILGPSLCIGEHTLAWEGPPSDTMDMTPNEVRVLFEGGPGEAITTHLDLVNSGTTVLYYSWEHVPNPNPLGTRLHESIQRFYFDTEGGVLFPGQFFSFPFMFKSAKTGIFTEKWSLCTGPVLCKGQPIHIVLRGISCLDDQHEEDRMNIDVKLDHRQATRAVRKVVRHLVNSIRTPPKTPPPIPPSTLEEDIFATVNPGVPYHYDVVTRLKVLYEDIMRPPEMTEESDKSTTGPAQPVAAPSKEKSTSGKKSEDGKGKKDKSVKDKKSSRMKEKEIKEVKEEAPPKALTTSSEQLKRDLNIPKWDLSIKGLQQLIMAIEDHEDREGKLLELNDAMAALSFTSQPKPVKRSYTIGYQVVCELVDKMVEASLHLRNILGLPVKEFMRASQSDTQMQEEQIVPSPSKEKKDKNEKKAAFSSATSKDKKEGKQKLQANKEEGTKGKGVGAKKSKSALSPIKASEKTEEESVVTIEKPEVDEVQEKKYLQLMHSTVYGLMQNSIDHLTTLL
ncbi:MYCBP-associated protein-like isoform X3 [Dysidea avara]|uniref:MYCBP-associated protein-like isoform X3 n=1 Tax=Dysidea avara TaxID=196820 RepID=UPI00332158A5